MGATTIYEILTQRNDVSASRTVPIGRPIANTRVYILDENLNPIPVGVQGELYIAGDGLAHGYMNRPDLTKARFLGGPFPFGREERLYKTGDLGRFRTDGMIECLGRIDRQTKIRGFRVELGEIEAVLSAHAAIEDIAVIAAEAAEGEKRLIAYAVSRETDDPSISDLRKFLAQGLPRHMIPGYFVFLDSLPRTPSGKVDYRSLPTSVRRAPEVERTRPETALEKTIMRIWAEVLGLERVGLSESFFEIGGHSLAAMRVLARLRESLGVEVPLRLIFDGATVTGLAEAIKSSGYVH
ncbi:MAG: non-ribosomal peptide synthetase [Gammaproteobacteria bacterium]|nr:non-ribosomal peptide synthetase [Gammaproteobacteria bacterium]